MEFEGGKGYIGRKGVFSVEMMPKEMTRVYKSGDTLNYCLWHVRTVENGLAKKHNVPLSARVIVDLISRFGYSLDDLSWQSFDAESTKGNPWRNQIKMENIIEFDYYENYIYFILAEGAGRVKIGWSSDMRTRFDFFATSSPFPLTVLHLITAPKDQERFYHRRFAHLRVHKEWFLYTDELKEFIENLKREPEKYRLTEQNA